MRRPAARRPSVADAVQVVVLANFAVAQPLLDLSVVYLHVCADGTAGEWTVVGLPGVSWRRK